MQSFIETGEAENVVVVTTKKAWRKLLYRGCPNCRVGDLYFKLQGTGYNFKELHCRTCKLQYHKK